MIGHIFISSLCLAAVLASQAAEARGGRFLGGLVTRGGASAVTHGIRKSYTPDTLTVDQLVGCLKRAADLDQESEEIEKKRSELKSADSRLDEYKRTLDTKEATLNRYSQRAIDDFNSTVRAYNAMVAEGRSVQSNFNISVNAHNASADAYNASCAKKFYADDMEQARRQAGL